MGKRNALAEEPILPPPTAAPSAQLVDVDKPRCKLFADLSFDKKVIMLRKTRTATKFSVRLTNELSRELEIPESRVHSWLRYKVYRNLHMKKSLTAQEIAALNEKFVEFDYLDDDTALLLADRFNVNTSVIKKAFQQRKPVQSQIVKPVIEVKKLNLPASVTITMVPKVTPDTSTPKESKKKMILSRFKTADQKNALFEAFRRSPTVTRADTVAELVEATGLTAIQVTKWFSVFRAKWSQSNESSLKKVLTRGLSSSQLAALEKSYRENRFLTNAQLIELPKNVGLSLRALQAWFSNRRVYEIRSNDKDLVNVGPKSATTSQNLNQIKIMKPVITIPQSDVQQQLSKPDVDLSADEFFESLSKEQKLHLKSACKNFSVSYKRLSRALGLPLDKVQHFIRSYRLKHNIFRFDNLKLPERVHKALLNHYLKYGKISTKTSVILGKRLKVRPEQIMNWNNYHTKRVLQVGGSVNRPAAIPAAEPVFVESIEDPVKVEAVESGEEDETRPSAQVPDPVRKTFSKKEFGGRGRRYFASASAKAILFEEFKKSPTAASTNIKKIAKLVKLTPMQVRKWLYNYGKTLGEQTISKVEACLSHPEIGDEARARLETEFRNCRYMEESDMENLAQQFGLTKRQVGSWFINARYYEALVGKCPGDDDSTVHVPTPAKPDTVSRLSGDSASSSTSRIRRRSLPEESTPSTQLDLLNLTIKQMEILVTEFEANPNLSDERAANMAKRVKITKDRIKAWFKNRRQELQLDSEPTKQKVPPIKIIMPKYTNSNDEMPTIATTDADSKKVPVQQNILFEEFKQSSKLTSERLVKITAETNLSGKQISAWFNWLNYKLSTIPKESLSEENRNKYLSLQQIEELEKYYTENRYANKAARESLSISLDVPKNIIKSWFASRRYYEILSEKGAIEDPISVSEDTDFAEFDASQSETVIDYDWENDPAAIDPLEQNDNEPVEIDPLLNSYCIEESVEQADVDVNIQIPENEIIEDLSSLPYVPRDRLVTPLGDNLEPLEENVERLFWFANKTPNTIKEKYNQEIDEAKTAILDSEFGKYPWPDLDRISQLSAQLLVSEPKIHWWFIKKRCFLTKTILTLPVAPPPKPKPESKNLLIDLTDDDQPEKPGEFEFVTLDDTTQIKREEEPSNENDTLTNGDPFDNNAIKTSNNNEEPPQDSNESNDNAATTPNSSASSSAKKKKVKIPLTSHQRAILLQEYKRNKFISSTQARIVAQDLGLTVTRIENWFESMRKSAARKKANLVEGSVSVKSLSPELESSLEAEYVKSANLSAKRAKMIALKLKTKKKTVKKWFTERAKRKEE